jgi:hypothetical protein
MNRRIFLAVLVMSSLFPLGAQDFQFTTFFDYYGGVEPSEGYENLRTRVYMQPRFSGYSDLGFDWYFSANLWVQPLGEPEAIDPRDILQEAYLLFPFPLFDITLGQKLITYGFADIYGPLNALHSTNRAPLSLDDGYDSRRPDPLVQLRFYPTFEDTIEVTYVPFTRPDRERPDSVSLSESGDQVVWSGQDFLWDLPHSVFINYNRYGEKADLQFFYGWYVEHTPDFEVPETDSGSSSVISPVYNRKHTFGAAYATRIGNYTLSQDFAFNLTSDFEGTDLGAQNSDITVNTQLLANLPGNILGQFSLIYSYFFNHGNHEAGADPASADYLAEAFQVFHTQPLQHIAFMIGHFEKSFLREKLKTQLNVGFFFSPEVYLAPRLAYSLTDLWSLEAGADITLGDPPDQALRRNPSDDNFYLRLVFRH